jgi:hypothetical protein
MNKLSQKPLKPKRRISKYFLLLIFLLVVGGFLIFLNSGGEDHEERYEDTSLIEEPVVVTQEGEIINETIDDWTTGMEGFVETGVFITIGCIVIGLIFNIFSSRRLGL